MKKEKLYFPEWNDEYCNSLSELKRIAVENDIPEFDATEAAPDNTQHEIYWCGKAQDFSDRKYCCKLYCDNYLPNKSGRGTCKYRQHCWIHGSKTIHVKI